MAARLQHAVVAAFDEHLARTGRARFEVPRRDREQREPAVLAGEARALDLVEARVGMLGGVALGALLDRAVEVEHARTALDADRVAAACQEAEPVVAEQRVLVASGDVEPQPAPRAVLVDGVGDRALQGAVPPEPGRPAPGAVADVDVLPARGLDDALDARDRAIVEIAGEDAVEADPLTVDRRVDLRPLRFRRDRAHHVDVEVVDEVAHELAAQELVLWHGDSYAGERLERCDPRAHLLEELGNPAIREERRLEDDQVVAAPQDVTRHLLHPRVEMEDSPRRVAPEGEQVVLDGAAQRVREQAVDDQDVARGGWRARHARFEGRAGHGRGAVFHREGKRAALILRGARASRQHVRYSARPLKPGLLELLVCPLDAAALTSQDGELTCAKGHRFPVRDGVPRLVPQEAGPLGDQSGTFDSFSAKWSRVDDEEIRQRVEAQYRWYVERFGFGDDEGLRTFLDGKETVLEAGTGLGGDAARFARLSDATVLGLDLSESIVAAQRQFGATPNLHYIQADLLRPPVQQGAFDFVSADQVVHHTPDAHAAVRSLAALLAPGGTLAFYVYKRKAPMREYADDYFRERTTRMSVEECMDFSASMSELGRKLSEVGATITLEPRSRCLASRPASTTSSG